MLKTLILGFALVANPAFARCVECEVDTVREPEPRPRLERDETSKLQGRIDDLEAELAQQNSALTAMQSNYLLLEADVIALQKKLGMQRR